ncbi:MAG: hypothetical protein RJB62_1092, partial [Pseudomonadota bacterium]
MSIAYQPHQSAYQLVALAQRIPSRARWLHAQQEILFAQINQTLPLRGPRSRKVDAALALAARFGVAWILALSASFFFTFYLYFKQYRFGVSHSSEKPIFVGIGALKDPELCALLCTLKGDDFFYLDETNMELFFRTCRVRFSDLLAGWISLRDDLGVALAQDAGVDGKYVLANAIANGFKYVYFRAWFRQFIRLRGPAATIAFSAASHVAFAAVAEGAHTLYLPHGFQARTLLYPDFDEVICSNLYEADHFRERLPDTRTRVVAPPFEPIETTRIAVIAGDYVERPDQ